MVSGYIGRDLEVSICYLVKKVITFFLCLSLVRKRRPNVRENIKLWIFIKVLNINFVFLQNSIAIVSSWHSCNLFAAYQWMLPPPPLLFSILSRFGILPLGQNLLATLSLAACHTFLLHRELAPSEQGSHRTVAYAIVTGTLNENCLFSPAW